LLDQKYYCNNPNLSALNSPDAKPNQNIMLAIPEEGRSRSKNRKTSNSPTKSSSARSYKYGRNSSSYKNMRNDMKASKSRYRTGSSSERGHTSYGDHCHRHDFAHNFYMNRMTNSARKSHMSTSNRTLPYSQHSKHSHYGPNNTCKKSSVTDNKSNSTHSKKYDDARSSFSNLRRNFNNMSYTKE